MNDTKAEVAPRSPARKFRAWLVSALLVAVGGWSISACAMTRNSDGSWKISFAPDMTITAWGLEDAKTQLYDLWQKCLSGSYARPCTAAEIKDIKDSYDRTIKEKGELAAHLEENPEIGNEELFHLIQGSLSDEEWASLGLTEADDLLALSNK